MKTAYFLIGLIVFGVLVYGKAFFAGFQIDDIGLIVNFPLVHSLHSVPALFTGGFSYQLENTGFFQFYYKPIMMICFAIFYSLGHGGAFTFHAFQIILFIVNSLLLFYFFSKIFGRNFAFLFSLLFLLHPANREVATYIASLQDTLYFFFGISALCLIINRDKRGEGRRKFLIIYLLLLGSCLSKETGMLFLFLILFWSYLFKKEAFKMYLYVSGFVFITYLALRLYASSNIYLVLLDNRILYETFPQRIYIIFGVIRFQIQEMVLPGLMSFGQVTTKTISFLQTVVSFFETIVFLGIICAIGLLLVQKSKKEFRYFLFFTAWLLLGIGLHSQIIELDVFAATRWLYFPLAGALGMVGLVVSAFFSEVPRKKRVFSIVYIIVLLFYIRELYLLVWLR